MDHMEQQPNGKAIKHLEECFRNPGNEARPIPKWIWNAPLSQIDAAVIREQFAGFKCHDGYGGVMIVLWGEAGYFSEEYLEKYGQAMDVAAELGICIILWDENGFPTGYAGGELAARYPQFAARRLDMTEMEVTGPAEIDLPVPDGALMAAVAMNTATGERADLTPFVDGGRCRHDLPEGSWKVMFFTCVVEEPFQLMKGSHRFMDYLNPAAVGKFIELTHQRYYDRFPQHFGQTIKYAFYDEPSFWRLQGRIWTEDFNRLFEEKHGYSPVLLYPSLWHDIGGETAAARNALLGLRAELYATAFIKTLGDWCASHGIQLTGHMDQEEIANPVPLSGDLMKVFEHQHMPGVDEIFAYGRGSRAYKIVSSAANNFDKPLVMCEIFGAMGEDMPIDVLYREAMDIYAKGVNFMVPHGTWYDNVNNVIFPPELSYRSAKFGPELCGFHRYVSRLSAVLQRGRHVCDIAVLYPIASLVAGNAFGQGEAYLGGVIAEETNYMELGELLSLSIRADFTYLHPEVLDRRCVIEGNDIRLENEINPERYRVLVLTGSWAIHWSNLKMIEAFYENGGTVIAVGRLPAQSAEFGHDRDVSAAMERLFGKGAQAGWDTAGYSVYENAAGGRAYRIPTVDARAIQSALLDALAVWDVRFEEEIVTAGGNLTYLHKQIDGSQVYFFANSGDAAIETAVVLRGELAPELWDPHTGEKRDIVYEHLRVGEEAVTRIRLQLSPVRSVFVVGS